MPPLDAPRPTRLARLTREVRIAWALAAVLALWPLPNLGFQLVSAGLCSALCATVRHRLH